MAEGVARHRRHPGDQTIVYTVDGCDARHPRDLVRAAAGHDRRDRPSAAAAHGRRLRPGEASTRLDARRQKPIYALTLVEPMQMPVGTSTMTRTIADGVVTTVTTFDVPSRTCTSPSPRARTPPRSPRSARRDDTARDRDLALRRTAVTGAIQTARAASSTAVAVTLAAAVFDASAAPPSPPGGLPRGPPHHAGAGLRPPTQGVVVLLDAPVEPSRTSSSRPTSPVNVVSPSAP